MIPAVLTEATLEAAIAEIRAGMNVTMEERTATRFRIRNPVWYYKYLVALFAAKAASPWV